MNNYFCCYFMISISHLALLCSHFPTTSSPLDPTFLNNWSWHHFQKKWNSLRHLQWCCKHVLEKQKSIKRWRTQPHLPIGGSQKFYHSKQLFYISPWGQSEDTLWLLFAISPFLGVSSTRLCRLLVVYIALPNLLFCGMLVCSYPVHNSLCTHYCSFVLLHIKLGMDSCESICLFLTLRIVWLPTCQKVIEIMLLVQITTIHNKVLSDDLLG